MKDITTGIKVALLMMLVAFTYLTAVTFLPMPHTGEEHSKTIVGFLLGTVFSTLINYYWGNSSKGQAPPISPTDEAAKSEVTKIESAKIEAVKVTEEVKPEEKKE